MEEPALLVETQPDRQVALGDKDIESFLDDRFVKIRDGVGRPRNHKDFLKGILGLGIALDREHDASTIRPQLIWHGRDTPPEAVKLPTL